MHYLLFVLICGIWSGSFILMKKAALAFTPLDIGAWRVAGGAAVLGILWRWYGASWSFTKRDVGPMLFVVLIGFAWPFTIQPHLVSLHGSAFIGMTVGFVPLATIAFSIPLLNVYPSRRQLFGVIGALGCLGTLLLDGLNRNVPLTDLGLAVTVPLSYAMTNTLIRRCLGHVSSLALSFSSLTLASSLLLPLSLLEALKPAATGEVWGVAAASLALLAIVGTGLATFWFNRLIQGHGPLFAGMVTNLVPLGALAWGWMDRERVTGLQIAALLGILVMVTIVQTGAAPTTTAIEPPLEQFSET